MASKPNLPAVQEHELDEADAEAPAPPWATHAWTQEEVTFVSEMLRHGNMTRAMLTARPPPTENRPVNYRQTAHLSASNWMKRDYIGGYIEAVQRQMYKAMIMEPEEVLARLSALARANMADFMVISEDGTAYTDLSNATRDQLAAIQEVTIDTYMEGKGPDEGRAVKSVRIKLAPFLPALELLGKKHKLFTDVIEDNRLADVADTLRERRQAMQRARQTRSEDDGS